MAKICGADTVRTLEDLEQDAVRIAAELGERGLHRGDRVLFKAQNSVGYVTVLLALMHAGASIVLLDHNEPAEVTERVIGQARVVLCVADEDAVVPETAVAVLTIYQLQLAAAGRAVRDEVDLDVRTWCELPDGLLMCSSGSTGTPKLVVKTGASFLANLRRNIDLVGHVGTDVLVPLLPFSHQYGLSMVLIAWLARCSLVVAPYRRLDHALRMAGLCGATVFDATPATYRSMVNIVRTRPALRTVVASARMLCVGAAPLYPGLVDQYVEEFGMPLLDSYGSTEMGNVSFASVGNPVACGPAVRGVDLSVVDDDGAEVPAGVTGEIMVRTPDLMTGYLDENGVLDPVEPGWFASGDFGFLDQAGNLHVLGRKRAVHRMGHTLYPDMIERKIGAAGCSAKVVALPDDRLGSFLVAFVEDDQNRPASYWKEQFMPVLPAYEQPNRVVVVKNFPLNRNGKPDGKRLEEMALEGASVAS
ncbi:class I adenylate-forming enzyme family protein [Lentzea albida]|uniref:Acyl-CoA synthetase (AMP-forming)/AMP-acid ligase II n=1 Tax=Lentzea albida TaxID=65499 RepID=A0A1H9X6C2_9PSEU|nr:class I adenylate-forming enzyme family protein [Lentzea albida]SES41682.1 Acyl-CoA synthetase (AMP-forming)/AMP-acid ligase II [Lentzea albida]